MVGVSVILAAAVARRLRGGCMRLHDAASVALLAWWPLLRSPVRTGQTVDFRILGPLEVTDQGREPAIATGKQRALLAILLLHANEVVSSDRLIEELWGDQPPASAAKSLQVHVSRLRSALQEDKGNGPDSVVVTRGGGYLIRVGPGQLDLERFEISFECICAVDTPLVAGELILAG